MAIMYLFACLLGALTTLTALSPYGWSAALLCAPLGGSAFALIVAALVVWTERAPVIPAPPPHNHPKSNRRKPYRVRTVIY